VYKGLLIMLNNSTKFGKNLLTLNYKVMKMKSLISIDTNVHITKKKELLKAFKDKFTDTELSKTKTVGTTTTIVQKQVVTAKDPIHTTARGIFRSDLVRYLALLSDDVKLTINGQKTTLQAFLNKQLDAAVLDGNHPLRDNKRSIWIDFAYGKSAPIAIQSQGQSVAIPGSDELQLIITAVIDGKHPADDQLGLACFTTASMSTGGGPIDPPFSGPVHPEA
jgi:hypothetical protein